MSDAFFVQLIADYAVFPVIILAGWALLMIPNNQKYRAYCRILLSGLTAFLLAKLLSTVYQPAEARPYELLGVTPGASYLDNPGFPSDHALFVTTIALAVWFETRRKTVSIILAAFVVIVSLGRVLALVHTPLDVIAGVLVACVGGLWYLQRDKPTLHKKHK
jgi:undecaprenyl-diphosphatase